MLGLNTQPQLIWNNDVQTITFSVKETYTTEDTRQLSIKQRRCVFYDEIQLKVDELYTYTGCMIQCRMEIMKRHCNCVPFFYPMIPGFKYCTMKSQRCITTIMTDIREISKCNCQLGCTNTIYEVESQQTNNIQENNSTHDIMFPLFTNSMEVGFISWPMVKYKREVLFGWVDLLVSFGGIAGLFLGFSLLSGVEIVYYFTIRTCIAAFRERRYLDRIRTEEKHKSQPAHDLSLVPYFISEPLPGHGIDLIVKRFHNTERVTFQKDLKLKKTKHINVEMVPPFGIEFVN